MKSSVHRCVCSLRPAAWRSSESRLVSADEVELKAIAMPSRQGHFADVARHRGRLWIERVGEAPTPRLLAVVLDPVSHSTDPVPAVCLDFTKPRSSEAGISDDDGTTALRQDGAKRSQELAMSTRAVVTLEGKNS